MVNIRILILRIKKLLCAFRSKHSFWAFVRHRVLVSSEHKPIFNGKYKTIIDIGANRGQFTLAARQWSPGAKVFAFEPLGGPAAIFRELFKNDRDVILFESAIGPEVETRKMHVSQSDDSSSLLPITTLQNSLFPGTEEVDVAEVEVAPLNEYVSQEDISGPAMLKLDVQGYEYEALIGCEKILPYIDTLYCECSFKELYFGQKLAFEVVEWLAERGFRISEIPQITYDQDGHSVQADLFFVR